MKSEHRPDAENERGDESDRTRISDLKFEISDLKTKLRSQTLRTVFQLRCSNLKRVPWVLLLRIMKTDSNKRTL